MKRLRLVFALLAALLWLPLLLLVGHALRTVEQEEAGRYKAVADRIFDEMERELTAFLRREEERPTGDYAFDAAQSPLRAPTEEPFVLGYAERDADGALHKTAWGRDADAFDALLAGSSLGAPIAAAKLEPSQGQVRKELSKLAALEELPYANSQSPGSTLELKRKGEPQAKSYDVLSALNRSVRVREESKKQAWSKESKERKGGKGDFAAYDPYEIEEDAARRDEADRQAADAQADSGTDQADRPPSPFASEPLGAQHLLLVRDVQRQGGAVKQGLVIALPALLSWLSERVLARGELESAARLRVGGEGTGRYDDAAAPDRAYRHRFGEPFAGAVALLALDPLPELEASGYSYSLSAALLFVAALALFAGYRMVAAVVSYAERRNDFVSAVTHELKTPLTAIRMYGEMLRDGVVPDPDKRSRYYRVITAESERLSRLIDNVLELARIERNQRQVSLSMGDVTPVVRETLEVIEPHASEQGFALALQADADLPAVRFDRDALAQVLFNLVDNALKYGSEAQDRTIAIRCERAGDGVTIRVADRGPGVAGHLLRDIWKPFFRGERELTRKHKGTGIGLALVRGLVERMGGQVTGRNTNPGFEVSVTLSA